MMMMMITCGAYAEKKEGWKGEHAGRLHFPKRMHRMNEHPVAAAAAAAASATRNCGIFTTRQTKQLENEMQK